MSRLPSLNVLEPKLADPRELLVRSAGHEAFNAAEIIADLENLRLFGAPRVLTLTEALALLGAPGEDETGQLLALGAAVAVLAEA